MIPHSRPTLGQEEAEAAARVVASGHVAQGSEVEAFEQECAALVGRRHGVAVNSGAAALHLALLVCGVSDGQTVAMPSYACAALPQAAAWCRASIRLCDSGQDGNLDTATVPEVDAVVVPHLFGAAADIDPGWPCAIEDIAQSIGGLTGRTGRVAVASFYATKLLTTGMGGMLLTDDAALVEHARDLRDYDNRNVWRTRHAYALNDIAAAIGRVQLRRLPGFVARRRELAARYTDALSGLPLSLPSGDDHVYFRYVVRLEARDALEAHLNARGIEAKRPVYRPAHHDLGGAFPGADALHAEALSLPLYPTLTDAEADAVLAAVRDFFDAGGAA